MTAETEKKTSTSSLLVSMAGKYGMDGNLFLTTLKGTVMKPGKDGRIPTNEEVAAFLMVANKYDLDPFTKEIYAFPDKRAGIIPIVGVDGFTAIANRNESYDGFEIEYAARIVQSDEHKPCPEWAEIKVFRKDRAKPIVAREYFDEVYCKPKGGYPGPWQSHTKRMFRHKVVIQGFRAAFGISGVYDEDEAVRIVDAVQSAPALIPEMPKITEQEAKHQTEVQNGNPITEAHVKTINKLVQALKLNDGALLDLLQEFGIEKLEDLKMYQFKSMTGKLMKMAGKNGPKKDAAEG